MKCYLLDTSALLTLPDNQEGAATVADILSQARAGTVRAYGCFMSQMEVHCGV